MENVQPVFIMKHSNKSPRAPPRRDTDCKIKRSYYPFLSILFHSPVTGGKRRTACAIINTGSRREKKQMHVPLNIESLIDISVIFT